MRDKHEEGAAKSQRLHIIRSGLALASLETRVLLVDDVYTALAANQTVGAVATLEGFE